MEKGTIQEMRLYRIRCYGCGIVRKLDGKTLKEAMVDARKEWDWSLGRDKRWRCADCRPRRFGERGYGRSD
jgi:hypothetical protein